GYLPVAAVGLDLAALALWLWMPAYLLLMQKRVYAQGWPATLLRFVAVGAVYSALMALAVAAVFVLCLARLLPPDQRRATCSSQAARRASDWASNSLRRSWRTYSVCPSR